MWGAIAGAALGYLGTKSTNKANSANYQAQIEWEREKAKNAHQWEVEDLRKAGLNPILSAGGSGAVVGSPVPQPVQNELGSGVSNALSIYNARNTAKLLSAQVEKTQNEAKGIKDKLQLEIDTLKQNLSNSAKQNERLQAEINNINENTRNQEANNFFMKEAIEAARPVISELKKITHNASSDTSWLDDVSSGVSNAWNDFKSYYFGKNSWDSSTPFHKNNNYMKGRRGRS